MRSGASSLADAIEHFFRSNHALKPLTVRCYRGSLQRVRAFVVIELGHEPAVADLTDILADRYIASVADHRYMARADCAVLKVFARWLGSARYLAADPLAAVSTPRVPHSRPKPLPDVVVGDVIRAAGETRTGPRDRAIVMLALATGARPNELRQLRYPEDVDLAARVICIREETSKTASGHRKIPLDPQAAAAIDDYVDGYRPDGPGPLFLNARGGPLTYYGFMAIFARLDQRLRARGISGFHAYRLRHTAITNFARTPGLTAFDVQQLAGHRRMETTRGYIAQRSIDELRRMPSSFSHIYGRVS